jgi:hypothetical protein
VWTPPRAWFWIATHRNRTQSTFGRLRLLRRSDLERALNAALRADVALQGTVINSPALNRYERHTQAATNTSAALNRML